MRWINNLKKHNRYSAKRDRTKLSMTYRQPQKEPEYQSVVVGWAVGSQLVGVGELVWLLEAGLAVVEWNLYKKLKDNYVLFEFCLFYLNF